MLRRTYKGEELWFELLDELGPSRLRRAMIGSGVAARVAGNLVWFLEDQVVLDRHQTDTTRTRYRHQLQRLDIDQVRRVGRALAIPG